MNGPVSGWVSDLLAEWLYKIVRMARAGIVSRLSETATAVDVVTALLFNRSILDSIQRASV